jgi:hypothetical protein
VLPASTAEFYRVLHSPQLQPFLAGHPLPEQTVLAQVLFYGLVRVNQDFREVSRLFNRSRVHVKVHENGNGPFAGRDIRIKNKYIA